MKRILFFLFIAAMASSCVSLDKVKYLQDAENYRKGDKTEFQNSHTTDYKVQAGDNLYIDVKSLDTKTSNPFLANQSMSYQMSTEAGVYLNSYLVNDSGYINFPVVGKVLVKGLTVNEVRDRLQKVVDEYFQFTTVTVKLVNFKISLLGEVVRPGTYQVYQNSINVLQAISLGGDLTNFANRKKISVIRKTKDGSSIHTINLLKSDILSSEAYFLQPDDIVYVEPMNNKNFTFEAFPYAILFSTISTTLLILNFLK